MFEEEVMKGPASQAHDGAPVPAASIHIDIRSLPLKFVQSAFTDAHTHRYKLVFYR